jgi:hypothetical protein
MSPKPLSPIAVLKEPFWKEYFERYVNDPFYWYQPKGFAIKEENLALIQKRLALLKQFEEKNWSRVQTDYTRLLAKKNLISLRKKLSQYSQSDYSALARMNKVIFTTLGLAWVDPESNISLTPVGKVFLQARSPQKIVQQQLLKYQLPNPALHVEDRDIHLFPHLFLVELLLCFPETGISQEEFILFVSRAKSISELPWIRECIENFRRLPRSTRQELISLLDRTPLIQDGKITAQSRRSSMLNTVRLDASYALNFFTLSDCMEWEDNYLKIPREKWGQAADLARTHSLKAYWVEYSHLKDWFSFYGDNQRTGSVLDALDYYEKTSNVVQAGQAYAVARQRGLIKEPLEVQDYVSLRIKERMLEDFLELNLHLLEDGLSLVGRQYPTLIGPIDLLARDRSKRYMVIELKKGKAADKVFGQMQRYCGFIKKELSPPDRDVRGAIVAREIDRKLKYAFHATSSKLLQLFRFEFQGKVEEISC